MTDNDEPCMCGTPFTCMADEHDGAVATIGGLLQVDVLRGGEHVATLPVVSDSVTVVGSDGDRCTDAFSTDYGDRRCDLAAGHDGYHVRNDGYGRPEYHWGAP